MAGEKSGARLSARSRDLIAQAIAHGEKMITILRSLLAADDESTMAEVLETWAITPCIE